MKKFIIKPTMGEMVEELAVVTLPSCCTAEKKGNEIVIHTPAGLAEAMSNVITMIEIEGITSLWSGNENKAWLRSKGSTVMKLISVSSGQEILFTKVTSGINGFQAVSL